METRKNVNIPRIQRGARSSRCRTTTHRSTDCQARILERGVGQAKPEREPGLDVVLIEVLVIDEDALVVCNLGNRTAGIISNLSTIITDALSNRVRKSAAGERAISLVIGAKRTSSPRVVSAIDNIDQTVAY